MHDNQDTINFGQKLNWLKTTLRVTDGEIGAAVGASDSLVCRWRNGERVLDRVRDANVIKNLAVFFAERAAQTDRVHILAKTLSSNESDIRRKSEAYCSALIVFLYDKNTIPNIQEKPPAKPISVLQESFIGMNGLLRALDLLESRNPLDSIGMTVYLSLEHSHIVRDVSAEKLWETLWRLGGGTPVKLVFDNWTDANEATKTLRRLLPFMQTGRLRLNLIKSTQKFFYNNMSFYAKGIGIIIASEPVSSFSGSVSTLVESPDYIKGMDSVFARFEKITKPVEKHLNLGVSRNEAVYFEQLFDVGSDLKTAIDGVNLLYMGSDAYMKLLKINNVTSSQRAYRLERFVKSKQQFMDFMRISRVTEIYSLPSFDHMLVSRNIKTPDFSFHKGEIKADGEILKSLFKGMMDSLEQHGNLSIYLNRRGLPYADFSCRLKGDNFVLLHSYKLGNPHLVWSDTWMLVYEYIRQFDDALRDGDLITTRDAVLAALRIRLESLEGNYGT